MITYRYKRRYKTTRIIISWVYNFILRFLFDVPFKDISSGARLISKRLLRKVKLKTNSPFIGAELAIKAKFMGYKVDEVGIHSFPNTWRFIIFIILTNWIYSFFYSYYFQTSKNKIFI